MSFRTDSHHNPAAFTTGIALQGGLIEGVDYEQGGSFQADGETYYTARLLGDPLELTIKVIDKIGYYTKHGTVRWIYIAIPTFIWHSFTSDEKRDIIGFHYMHEGGTEMRHLFPNYGKT